MAASEVLGLLKRDKSFFRNELSWSSFGLRVSSEVEGTVVDSWNRVESSVGNGALSTAQIRDMERKRRSRFENSDILIPPDYQNLVTSNNVVGRRFLSFSYHRPMAVLEDWSGRRGVVESAWT